MDSHELIDAQFDRAVEIVQSLPKNGPIQTDYEEKLTMYRLVYPPIIHPLVTCWLTVVSNPIFSLYKQGTHVLQCSILGTLDQFIEQHRPSSSSNCGQCHAPKTWHLGHAGSSQVVRNTSLPCKKSRVNALAGMHGRSTRTWTRMKQNGCMWML